MLISFPDGGFWLAIIGSSVVTPLLFYVFFRYLLKFWRLEAFTMRRLVVRFNRETRKVYFLRPTFLGGVKAYNWEDIDAALPKDMPNHEGVGGMLVLGAITQDGGNPYVENTADGAYVGNACRDYQHLLSFWEYIRRFMEDGADAVPAPKRLRSKWPNPLRSMLTVSHLSLPGGFDLGRMFLWLRLVLAPVFFIWGLGHYALAAAELRAALSQGDPRSQPRIGSPFTVGAAGLQPAAAALYRRRVVAVVCLAAQPGLAPAVALAGWALMPYRMPVMDATACRRAELRGQPYEVS